MSVGGEAWAEGLKCGCLEARKADTQASEGNPVFMLVGPTQWTHPST